MRSRMQGPAARWLGAGMLAIAMLAGCGGGGGGSETAAPPPVAAVPQPAILFAGAVSAAAEGADVIGSTGGQIELDASGSKDGEGGTLSFAWSIVSKPSGSALNLASASAAKLRFLADVSGSYVFKLRVTNGKGGFAEKNATVSVNNRVPNAVLVINASYKAQPVAETPVSVSAGSRIVLDASGSTNADGDKITTTWELLQKPAASVPSLAVTDQAARFKPDVPGLYAVRAYGTDGKGQKFETVYWFDVNNALPNGATQDTVAVISRDKQTVTVGQPVVASGLLSYDEDGGKLNYVWAVDSRPAGSVAVLGASTVAVPSFTPDVSGAYVLSMTVSNGRQTAVAYLKLNVIAPTYSVVALPFRPLKARYNMGRERLIVATASPDALRVINPVDGASASVSLPAAVKTFDMSADGKLAAVLHEGMVSLVDLETLQLLRSTATADFPTEVFVNNAGVVFLSGQSKGLASVPLVEVLNARTGQVVDLRNDVSAGFYGDMQGIFVPSRNTAYLVNNDVPLFRPSDFIADPKTGILMQIGYAIPTPAPTPTALIPMAAPFFLSVMEGMLGTASGTYFNANTLEYIGRYTLNSPSSSVLSMSYSTDNGETLLMENDRSLASDPTYQANYRRYTGLMQVPAGKVALPYIDGEQSYGIGIFHTSINRSVALVQTGGALKSTPRAKYYLVYR
jgi:hypothetical protein